MARPLQMLVDKWVTYADMRKPNSMWNEELQRVMIIDFHCLATLNVLPADHELRQDREIVVEEETRLGRWVT
jgi:hypothetical protein